MNECEKKIYNENVSNGWYVDNSGEKEPEEKSS